MEVFNCFTVRNKGPQIFPVDDRSEDLQRFPPSSWNITKERQQKQNGFCSSKLFFPSCLISHRSGGRLERVVLLPRLNLQLKGLLSQRLVVDLFYIKKTIFPQDFRQLLFTILYLFHPVDETGGWVDGEVTILVAWQKKIDIKSFIVFRDLIMVFLPLSIE